MPPNFCYTNFINALIDLYTLQTFSPVDNMSPMSKLRKSPMYVPMKIESGLDILPQLDSAFDEFGSISYGGECCSLTSSFQSSSEYSTDYSLNRRPSLASSTQTASTEAFWTPSASSTSPTTPLLLESGIYVAYPQHTRADACLTSSHALFDHLRHENRSFSDGFWHVSHGDYLPQYGDAHDLNMMDSGHVMYPFDLSGLGQATGNPPLTKSIFASPDTPSLSSIEDNLLDWRSHAVAHPAQTVEPSVAFKATIPSSPSLKVEPSTPCNECFTPSVKFNHSSPLCKSSPQVLPSQHDLDDLVYSSVQLNLCESKKARTGTDRLSRREYRRKLPVGTSSKSKSTTNKTGMDCPPLIAQNLHACKYEDCRKRFRRSEHKKRHENSVHATKAYECWVPECKTRFSRTDNLKSHMMKTHSKKPGVRGNRYVATLDPNSEYYNPEWVGELDKDGYPIPS